jgi:hypothetical protein
MVLAAILASFVAPVLVPILLSDYLCYAKIPTSAH